MKAIITVLGKDQVGIIAGVSSLQNMFEAVAESLRKISPWSCWRISKIVRSLLRN